MTWIGVLTTGATVTDGLSRWAIAAAVHTNGWREWGGISRKGQRRLAWQHYPMSNSASGQTGAARQTPAASSRPAPSRGDSTEGQRSGGRRMKRLGMRGDNELETVKLTCRRRENEGTRDERQRSRTWTCQWSWGDHKLETGSKRFNFMPGLGEGARRYDAIKAWFWAGRRRPEAACVPALARFVLVDMYLFVI